VASQESPVDTHHVSGPSVGAVERVGNVVVLSFFVSGKPVPKGRPRFRNVGSYVQTYTPKNTVDWEREIGEQVGVSLARLRSRGALEGIELPIAGRVMLNLRFNLAKPKSAPKKLRFQLKKPDLDNLDKALIDALSNIALIKDDNIVTDITTCKRFASEGHPEGVEVELTTWLEL
jgi:Holliday junction resolvase RusA-like endonuclease